MKTPQYRSSAIAAGKFLDPAMHGAALRVRAELIESENDANRPPLSRETTLTLFYQHWFLPVVLEAAERRQGTLDNYRNTLQWWALLTCDPPLCAIDDQLIAGFVAALKKTGYRRSPDGQFYPLSSMTIRGHVTRLSSMLTRAGHHAPRRGPCARLLTHLPSVPHVRAVSRQKPRFTLEEARQIAAACSSMVKPDVTPMQRPLCLSAAKWWRAFIGLLFYTGLRSGTIMQLRWRHLCELDGHEYIDVPASITKAGKSLRIAIHPQLSGVLKLRAGVTGEHLILPRLCVYRTVLDFHATLQRLAGLKGVQILSPHAWRRTHGQLLGEMGLSNAEKLASVALDHGSVAVTKASYVSIVDHCRLQLPDLWPQGVSGEEQRLLFDKPRLAVSEQQEGGGSC